MPRPVRRGMAAVARMAAQSSAVSPRAWPRPRPTALAGEALQNAADAIMGGGIVGARVTVSCADGRPDRADRGGRGALLGALGEVGGDGRRIGGRAGGAGGGELVCHGVPPWLPSRSGRMPG